MRKMLLVGVGGTGENLLDRISREPTAKGRIARSILLDTLAPDGEKTNIDYFYLGGFHVGLAITDLNLENLSEETQRELQTFQGTLNFGAAARTELGALALRVHRRRLEAWLLGKLREAKADSTDTTLDILVLGSLCGGTGGGVLPQIGLLLRTASETLGLSGKIVGFGVTASAFEWMTGSLRSDRVYRQNEDIAISEMRRRSGPGAGGHVAGYDDFFLVETSTGATPWAVYDLLATRICVGLDDSSQLGFAEALADDGIALLTLEEGEVPTPQLLWSSGRSFLNLLSGGPGQSTFAVFVPSFSDVWTPEIREFRELLRTSRTSENEIQRFLENHPRFLTGFDYSRAVPQVCVHSREEGLLRPDFMLVPFDSEFADIVELKSPRSRVVVRSGKHARLAATVTHAVAQLRAYERFFDSPDNRERFRARHGFTAFKPRLTVVIGTAAGKRSELLFRRLVADDRSVDILTYDDLITRAARYASHQR